LKNIDIDMVILENIDIDMVIFENIDIDKAILENIDIDIDKDNPENIDIGIDIDKDILKNIDNVFFEISISIVDISAFFKIAMKY